MGGGRHIWLWFDAGLGFRWVPCCMQYGFRSSLLDLLGCFWRLLGLMKTCALYLCQCWATSDPSSDRSWRSRFQGMGAAWYGDDITTTMHAAAILLHGHLSGSIIMPKGRLVDSRPSLNYNLIIQLLQQLEWLEISLWPTHPTSTILGFQTHGWVLLVMQSAAQQILGEDKNFVSVSYHLVYPWSALLGNGREYWGTTIRDTNPRLSLLV